MLPDVQNKKINQNRNRFWKPDRLTVTYQLKSASDNDLDYRYQKKKIWTNDHNHKMQTQIKPLDYVGQERMSEISKCRLI